MLSSEQRRFSTIAELAAKYAISLRTLRFYEERGLLAPLRQGLLRLYDAREEVKLQIIRKGRRLGFSLAEIELLLAKNQAERSDALEAGAEAQGEDFLDRLTSKQIENQLVELERERNDLNEAISNLRQAQQSR